MVSGTLGDSALGLQGLMGQRSQEPFLQQRHLSPTPRVALGCGLAAQGLASSMIDISDGLSADLEHILQASQVDAVLDQQSLPLSNAFQAQLESDDSLLDLALHGGEDYELLFTVAPEAVSAVVSLGETLNVAVTDVGVIEAGTGQLRLRDAQGEVRPILVRGYDHFCRSDKSMGPSGA